ncbi:MAG: peptidase C45 [Flavobacteriales bacterium]|nr:peptidase C45 [Flavobacteriales bacterium]
MAHWIQGPSMLSLFRTLVRSLVVAIELIMGMLLVAGCWALFSLRMPPPVDPDEAVSVPERIAIEDGWRSGTARIQRNRFGLWEAYLEGGDLERGLRFGSLARELVREQEELFIERIKLLVPDEQKLKWLRWFLAFFNRDLEKHVPEEFKREIYGVSRSFSPDYDLIGEPYERALNYHGAHDIGHALQDLALVGCTSFAAWGKHTKDGELLIGRNFDFDMGEAFACNKIVLFMRPEKGIPFAQVTWAGMMGTVSGMNLEGLTVTINASRSRVPTAARTPISILAREILQYASDLEEAVAIAGSREVFVSESILVGSAKDGRALIIEKAPDGMGIYDPESGRVVCANHYQSGTFAETVENLANLEESDSRSRFVRMNQLLDQHTALGPVDAAEILRDMQGPDGRSVGSGNPIAINQLIAHHSVIFQPATRKMWVSAGPFQIGPYVSYDLDHIFSKDLTDLLHPLLDPAATIPADSFLTSPAMDDFVWHRAMRTAIKEQLVLGSPWPLSKEDEERFIATDPENYDTFVTLGDLFAALDRCDRAEVFYAIALDKVVASEAERRAIEKAMTTCGMN